MERHGLPDLAELIQMLHDHNTEAERPEAIAGFIGAWALDGRFRLRPDQDWSDGNGVVAADWAVGGRYLQMSCTCTLGVRKMSGMSMICSDPVAGRLIGFWISSLRTRIIPSSGVWDAQSRTLREERTVAPDGTGVRVTWNLAKRDLIGFTAHQLSRDGAEDILLADGELVRVPTEDLIGREDLAE